MVTCAGENNIKSKVLRWRSGVLVRCCLKVLALKAAPDAEGYMAA